MCKVFLHVLCCWPRIRNGSFCLSSIDKKQTGSVLFIFCDDYNAKIETKEALLLVETAAFWIHIGLCWLFSLFYRQRTRIKSGLGNKHRKPANALFWYHSPLKEWTVECGFMKNWKLLFISIKWKSYFNSSTGFLPVLKRNSKSWLFCSVNDATQ